MRTVVLIVKRCFMNFDSQCAIRLKNERKRLGFNQASIAELCGISREIWGKYERGAAVPGGNVLCSFALNGANVQFILTGQESGGVALTRDEHDLINHFRNAPLAIKAAVFAALTAGNSVSNSVNVSGNGNRVAGRDYNEKK
ncbi:MULTISPECIES: helix-turn-helix domain-containing protein [Citrobacter]|jgi:transcriptional regulator with XRE-family HTH domain|uniref:helix-turn-helix domain-containing protein n=1 Tax=Citrobacter TaxID=544 RepID=UPI001F120705|nr:MULTISPECIES: XRE family transcriptional regulator [Citrobacter]MCR3679658.1 XRE family transcriptional regulator [Citrobacter freundii]DAY52907.1 MAG TPA: Helix-turn-helix XRE-family like protein [Caudoviricetes sp.]